jgi:hypothetical protein
MVRDEARKEKKRNATLIQNLRKVESKRKGKIREETKA